LTALPQFPTNILLHFEGGWPLKVYPPEHIKTFIGLLLNRECNVTVLGADNYGYEQVTAVSYESLEQFTALLKKQHIFVGMDSFPVIMLRML